MNNEDYKAKAGNTKIVMDRIEHWMRQYHRWSNRHTRDYMFATALHIAIITALESGTLKDETSAVDEVIKSFVISMPLPELTNEDAK